MNIKDLDLAKSSKIIQQQIDYVTCIECCKYYIAPETASCGHSLCHSCWRGRSSCPACAKPLVRRNLRHNLPLQNITEHVHTLCEAFEKRFKIKLLEYLLDNADTVESDNDPTKTVNEWLANSENHFSVATLSSKQPSQETKKHTEKIAGIVQDNWDKIEPLPDTEQIITNKENVIGPMDIETFDVDYDEYAVNNLRRSSRKQEGKQVADKDKTKKKSLEKQSSKNSSTTTDKKLTKLRKPVLETNQHNNPLNIPSSKTQSHNYHSKPDKLIRVPTPQDDWDKIETMPDTEEVIKSKENDLIPMDIEVFDFENNYTANNPRRSSRKRELKPENENDKLKENNSLENQNLKDSSGETDKKPNKGKRIWNNVKRMRKEFSKLNKINRSKLNVSIEMCKKTQNTAKTNIAVHKAPSPKAYEIDENTPGFDNPISATCKPQINNNEIPKEQNNEKNLKEISTHISSDKIETNNHLVKPIQESNKRGTSENIVANQEKNNIDSQETNAEIILPSNIQTKQILGCELSERGTKLPFYKKSALYPNTTDKSRPNLINIDSNTAANDDIEITIKVGNTITKAVIKRNNDVELKVSADCETQTSFTPYDISLKTNAKPSQSTKSQNIVNVGDKDVVQVRHSSKTRDLIKPVTASVKSVSEKKNTDSADTATVQFEITESVEKELSKVMDCVEIDEPAQSKKCPSPDQKSKGESSAHKPASKPDDMECIDDLDIFESESVKESDVKLLKNTEHAPSEILLCTTRTKNRTQKTTEKRNRDLNDVEKLPNAKKAKLDAGSKSIDVSVNKSIEPDNSKHNEPESESTNYDVIMGTVFASIDADIELMDEIRRTQNIDKNTYTLQDNNKDKEPDIHKEIQMEEQSEKATVTLANSVDQRVNQKDSENIFSVNVDKEDEHILTVPTTEKVPQNVPPANIEDFLTPMMCNVDDTGEAPAADDQDIDDDSDKSVVEETPQKTTSFTKKQKNNVPIADLTQPQNAVEQKLLSVKSLKSGNSKLSIVNLVDTSAETSREITVVETADKKALETPLNINKFVNHITHKSTPMARKSLNFETEDIDIPDPEQTMCPTNDTIAKTTQEKEFIRKVFEKSPAMTTVKPTFNLGLRHRKICIAGTCLTSVEIGMLKQLCARQKWTYTDKYCKELTHLVVGVDDENKSQRSVKYMSALASSKWIVSFEWVEKCLQSKDVIIEEPFEALDTTGEPGPRRSRLAANKLFQGITFYCMEPFSVLDVNTLKEMLEASGGRVVKEVKQVKVTEANAAPAVLLAEPEHTQEDRFIYLAMEQSIVPVNYEWALNCLGAYTLMSIQELLLCPSALLPKPTAKWPQELIARDDD